MKNPQPLRHPSLVLQQIRSEYQVRQKITTQAAQKHLSNICGWSESTWGNLERSTPHSGQAWDPDYTWNMVNAGIIRDGGKYHQELVAWERAVDTAAHIAAREEYRRQQEGEQQTISPNESAAEAVKAVTEDKTADNEDEKGHAPDLSADNEEEGEYPMALTASGSSRGNRRWYWIAGIGGCLLLLSLCIVTVAASYFFWGQTQRAQQTPDSPTVIEIEREVTRIVRGTEVVEPTEVIEKEVTRIVEVPKSEATVAPEQRQPVEATRPPEVVPSPATPEPSISLAYGRLLYEETFERDTETWAIWDGSRIQSGQLVIVPDTGAHPHSDEQYSEFIFEVEFRPENQAANPELSIFVHFQVPQCTIPQCGIVTSVKAVQRVITVRKHTETETIRIISDVSAPRLSPNTWNTVTIVVKGDEYRIFANGAYVDHFTDSTYTKGKFLLWAEGGGEGRGPIAINAVRVYDLP